MKIIRCLIVLASVLLFCPALSRAQEQGPSSQSAEDSPTRIETKFDTAKNETTVGFKTLLVIDTKTEKLLVKSVQLQFSETSFALVDEHLAMLGKLADLLHL
jgi:hypothetical protein